MDRKKCIFHIPYKVSPDIVSGSHIRPLKMLNAFKNIGYDVDVIMGYGQERQKAIENIKFNIKNGQKYDFLYTESSTMPTLLTEKNHIPQYPFLDFGFFKYCKKNNIKIGLFYRDIHWKFEQYKNNVGTAKRIISTIFYNYDLKKYRELVDVLYLPSKEMFKYLDINFTGKVEKLPPGSEENYEVDLTKLKNDDYLNIFYVGGISTELYDIQELFKVANELPWIKLTVCCRIGDWNAVKDVYSKYLNDRINIIHKSGEELYPYVKQADILNLFIRPTHYWEFAVPVKLFTYISYKKPIISSKNTVTGNFVESNNIGWSIDYSKEELIDALTRIKNNREEILEKTKNMKKVLQHNTWNARAKKVVKDLVAMEQGGK
ncbi:glycosyltransferase family 1 protein [Clostridium botulinum]|uniref:Glycosyl transferase n=1 Tax=Clostridium botulinum D str. 1873 TaxID=592027 RepID=A0A9P2LKI5_CLOBO|nr:glycosyltransferase family 1 protein [Clostridium botulinum]EES90549.1 putative glycosyl transferase [Clostridium botulinum D str. 1873]MCD3216711.1 glycosyltransferase family 1 protein [Clostridium botulinum C]MCD3244559.1 glycosyltransferase family 1 protein [Clostridium botulinum C]MCD3261118.1 glycosyltransferase family 1 protein [Clostridium botulinum C]NFV47613.1 glycosyltransferase family 1 protein [Clostridium botulinum]